MIYLLKGITYLNHNQNRLNSVELINTNILNLNVSVPQHNRSAWTYLVLYLVLSACSSYPWAHREKGLKVSFPNLSFKKQMFWQLYIAYYHKYIYTVRLFLGLSVQFTMFLTSLLFTGAGCPSCPTFQSHIYTSDS